MIPLPAQESDDAVFLALAAKSIVGTALLTSTPAVRVVKIDSWFGDRWYTFAGKAIGAFGVRDRDLKVPPFHPHRVVGEWRLRSSGAPVGPALDRRLHTLRTSGSNLNNSISRLGKSITLGWYSGDTAATGRGAVMVYSSTPHGPVGWYAGLERGSDWSVVKLVGADERMWAAVLDRGAAARRSEDGGIRWPTMG